MKSVNNSRLRLISSSESATEKNCSGKLTQKNASYSKAALSLLAARTTGRISKEAIDTLALVLQEAKGPNTIVQRSFDVSIVLKNTTGDASICYKYELANFGQKTLHGRTHRFWFTTPQEDINISVCTDSGIPLEIEKLASSPNFIDFRVLFLSPLQPADQLAYRIQYELKKVFLHEPFYEITAGTFTQNISMTVIAPANSHIESMRVGLESADGYISDSPPVPSISTESGRDKLVWNYQSAKLGDQFRTYWSIT